MKRILLTYLLLLAAPGLAHQQTERYIPIGESSAATVAGRIEARQREPHQLTVAIGGARETVSLDHHTQIWIDRSADRRTNLTGTFEDCSPGRYVEVKYGSSANGRVAEWVKVRAD